MEIQKRGEPEQLLSAFQRQVGRLFGDFFGYEPALFREGNGEGFLPALDIAETPEAVVVTAEVPGLDPKDLQVTVEDGRLLLRGEKKEEKEEKGKHWHRLERRHGSFERSLVLPPGVEADKVEAVSRNGVVTITLPKKKEARGRQVPVKAGG